jgi:hypothetical protein
MNDETHYEGGPAFPAKLTGPCEAFGLRADSNHMIEFHGMTLRDYFAAKAMLAILGNQNSRSSAPDFVSEWAYKHADAMLKEREK